MAASDNSGEGVHLKRWLSDNGCYITAKTKDRKPETHLLMDGGRVHVPDSLGAKFMAVYCESIDMGEWLYVVEQRTEPTFRYFCEFDFRTVQRLDVDGSRRLALRIGSILQTDVFSAYAEGVGPEDSKVMVSFCPCSEEKPGTYKVGMHFNWRCDVRLADAIVLRGLAVRRFSRLTSDEFGFSLPESNWGEVVDASVYDRCGLRLLYSRKNEACPACKGRPFVHVPKTATGAAGASPSSPSSPPPPPKPTHSLAAALARTPATSASPLRPLVLRSYADTVVVCPACQGKGRIDCGRVYQVATVLDKDGKPDDDLGMRCALDRPFGVKWSSIRGGASCGGPTAKLAPVLTLKACPEVAELMPAAEEDAKRTIAAGPYRFTGRVAGGGGIAGAGPNAVLGLQQQMSGGGVGGAGEPIDGYMEDVTADPRGVALATFVREREPGAPEAIAVKMYNGTAGKVPGVTKFYVVHTCCHYCQNKGAEHQSSQVYFVATPAGVTQRCFSQKGVVYSPSNTTCSNYRSALLTWDGVEDLRDKLFGAYCRRSAERLDRELTGEPPRKRGRQSPPSRSGEQHQRPRQPPKKRKRTATPTPQPPRQSSPPFERPANEFADMLSGLADGSYQLNKIA